MSEQQRHATPLCRRCDAPCEKSCVVKADPLGCHYVAHLIAFVEAFKVAYPNIRQLQDGFAQDNSWSEWDQSVREATMRLGGMAFNDPALETSPVSERKACEWLKDVDGIFHTSCGHDLCFDATLKDCGVKFCQCCGGEVTGVTDDD